MIDNEMWGPVSEKYKKNTKDIINAANHLKEAVNNILDSAKLDAGLIETTPESFSLKSVIQDAFDAISPILESREIKVTGIDDNIYSDPCTGIGFGLSYVKKLIEKHNGSLSIISAPNEGSKINLNLPKSRLLYPE